MGPKGDSMKIALLGYGKMGRLIEEIAQGKGHEIVAKRTRKEGGWKDIERADICLDFSEGPAVVGHVRECARLGKSVVIGTTGWEEGIEEVKRIAEQLKIGILYAPNFSLGVHLFLQILDSAAKVMDAFDEYQVGGVEFHSLKKKDAPSGTAREISRRLERAMGRIDRLEMTAVRLGSIPGTHEVIFDSPADTIVIRHVARSREGFAKGAIQAAEWLLGKTGFYTIDDLLGGH